MEPYGGRKYSYPGLTGFQGQKLKGGGRQRWETLKEIKTSKRFFCTKPRHRLFSLDPQLPLPYYLLLQNFLFSILFLLEIYSHFRPPRKGLRMRIGSESSVEICDTSSHEILVSIIYHLPITILPPTVLGWTHGTKSHFGSSGGIKTSDGPKWCRRSFCSRRRIKRCKGRSHVTCVGLGLVDGRGTSLSSS